MAEEGLIDGIGVQTEQQGRRTILTLSGELDLVSAPRLRNAIASLRSEATDEVVVDLSALTYIDSVGIGLLVASRRRLDGSRTDTCAHESAPHAASPPPQIDL